MVPGRDFNQCIPSRAPQQILNNARGDAGLWTRQSRASVRSLSPQGIHVKLRWGYRGGGGGFGGGGGDHGWWNDEQGAVGGEQSQRPRGAIACWPSLYRFSIGT